MDLFTRPSHQHDDGDVEEVETVMPETEDYGKPYVGALDSEGNPTIPDILWTLTDAQLEHAPGGVCMECLASTRAYKPLMIPDVLWERINPTTHIGGGELCPNCISLRLDHIGNWDNHLMIPGKKVNLLHLISLSSDKDAAKAAQMFLDYDLSEINMQSHVTSDTIIMNASIIDEFIRDSKSNDCVEDDQALLSGFVDDLTLIRDMQDTLTRADFIVKEIPVKNTGPKAYSF